MCRVPFPYVALIRWGVELGWGGLGNLPDCTTARGVPFYSPAAVVVQLFFGPAAVVAVNSLEVEVNSSEVPVSGSEFR